MVCFFVFFLLFFSFLSLLLRLWLLRSHFFSIKWRVVILLIYCFFFCFFFWKDMRNNAEYAERLRERNERLITPDECRAMAKEVYAVMLCCFMRWMHTQAQALFCFPITRTLAHVHVRKHACAHTCRSKHTHMSTHTHTSMLIHTHQNHTHTLTHC